MYTTFFGFTEKPFNVTPDPRFLYLSPEHRETLATLIYGIQERRGFIAVVGEVGTGKTTLLNTLLGRLDERTKVAYVFNSDVTAEQLITNILVELGLVKTYGTLYKGQAIDRLNQFAIEQLGRGCNVVVIVDEAQNLGQRAMENLRLLSNLETHTLKLIQIILSGQPELDVKLNKPELRQLSQRISLKRYITPLSEAETDEYIRHRLAIAGYKGAFLFDRRAQQLIWEYSGGVPRKINILCDNALLIAYGLKRHKIKEDVMAEAIKDLTWSPFSGKSEPHGPFPIDAYISRLRKRALRRTLARAACIIALSGVLFAIGFQMGKKDFYPLAEIGARVKDAVRARIGHQPAVPDKITPEQASLASVRGVITPNVKSVLPLEETARAETPSLDSAVGSPKASEQKKDRISEEIRDIQASLASSEPTALASLPETAVEESKSMQLESVKAVETPPETSPEPEAPSRLPAADDPSVKRVDRPNRVAFVKPGDTLSRIILRVYGVYSKERLKLLLAQNPDIIEPDQIFVGQAIQLPDERE